MVAISTPIEAVNEPTQKEEYMAFRDFDTTTLHKKFQLTRIRNYPLLDDWLLTPFEVSKDVANQLEQLREKIDFYGAYYNEAELKWHFLNPLIELVDYNTEHYHIFNERTLAGEVAGVKMRGTVNLVVAAGKFTPEAPYFFLHEYKKEKGTFDDVLAQLLSAMLVAQKINDNSKPVYGCYLIGRLWHFVILKNRDYIVSTGYVASDPQHIRNIYTALVNMKTIIETELIGENNK